MKAQNLYTRLSSRLSVTHLLFLVLILIFTACQSNPDRVELVFTFGPDDTGTVKPLIKQFNKENKGVIHVTWKEGARSTDEFYQEILADFNSENPEIDIFCSDVIWTPALVADGMVEDVSEEFFAAYKPQDFIEASMNSAAYQFRIWGVPWFADAGMLFYRKDLLEKSGFEYPPATWEELVEMSKKIQQDSGVKHGYVFQGAEYEGGATNACEFIWNAGGQIMIGDLSTSSAFGGMGFDPNVITVSSNEVRDGLADLAMLAKSGILPPNIGEFQEQEASSAFLNGEAVFMRNWAGTYGLFLDNKSKVKPKDVGLTPLPTSEPNMIPYSCLGGWNLMLSSKISEDEKEAAWKFIKYLASPESQKFRAMKGGFLPSLKELYADDVLLDKARIVKFAKQVIPVCRERPRSPHYMEMSPEIAKAFNQVLKGETTPDMAVLHLDMELEKMLADK